MMYPKEIESILNDSSRLLTERRKLIQYEIDEALANTDPDSFVRSILSELVVRVNMFVKEVKE